MRYERTREETLKDKALLLVLLAKAHSAAGQIGDRLKMQKLSFLLCYPLFQRRMKALNLIFFTYRWGPFTKDLYDAETDFEEAGLLFRQGRTYRLTESGIALASNIERSLHSDTDNREILSAVDDVVNAYGGMSTQELVDLTHQMKVVPVGWQQEEVLENLPHHLDLTRVLDDEEATAILEMDLGWLDSFGHALASTRRSQSATPR